MRGPLVLVVDDVPTPSHTRRSAILPSWPVAPAYPPLAILTALSNELRYTRRSQRADGDAKFKALQTLDLESAAGEAAERLVVLTFRAEVESRNRASRAPPSREHGNPWRSSS